MRKLILCSLITLCSWAVNAQTVDNAVRGIMNPQIDSIKASISSIQTATSNVYWDTVYVVSVTRASAIDTLTAPGIYELSVTGSVTAVRYVMVSASNGIVSIRTANPLAWSGIGAWSTSVVNNRVIVSTTATNIIYQRKKL